VKLSWCRSGSATRPVDNQHAEASAWHGASWRVVGDARKSNLVTLILVSRPSLAVAIRATMACAAPTANLPSQHIGRYDCMDAEAVPNIEH